MMNTYMKKTCSTALLSELASDSSILLRQCDQYIREPGTVQSQRFVGFRVPTQHIEARGVHAEQYPRERLPALAPVATHNRGTTGTTVGACIREEIAVTLEAHRKRGGIDRVPYDGQFVQGIVESEWKAHDHHRRGYLDMLFPLQQVVRRESKEGHVCGLRTAIDFYHGNE